MLQESVSRGGGTWFERRHPLFELGCRGKKSWLYAVNQPATWYHHALPEITYCKTHARMTPANPFARYPSHDRVMTDLITSSRVPRINIGIHGAMMVWILPMITPLIAGMRKNPAGPATNKVAKSIIGRCTSGRRR